MLGREQSDTLLLFPCCARKRPGGREWDENGIKLQKHIGKTAFNKLCSVRENLLQEVQNPSRNKTDAYTKNIGITFGPDFGGDDREGRYLPAVDRYTGTLYSANPLAQAVKSRYANKGGPQMLIVSSLYGPVHPLEFIQDHELRISDREARKFWIRYFPEFLKEYVELNSIKQIKMYFGKSTPYFDLAYKSVAPLMQSGLSLNCYPR